LRNVFRACMRLDRMSARPGGRGVTPATENTKIK
jgi:hypothetical protein